MTPPINRIDLERMLKTFPPEMLDPFPHLDGRSIPPN